MRSKFKWIFTLLLAFTMQFSFAQEKTVTGVVSDKTGTLPGANVVVKGTKRSAQTDFDGKYTITAKAGEVLVFSFTGYNNSTVTVGAANSYNVKLVEESVKLEEVVVDGYRTTKRAKSAVAQTTINAKVLQDRPNANFIQSLQAQVPGLYIAQSSGSPGSNKITSLIRGISSLNGNTEPVYVIDGIAANLQIFRSINPNDIESATVLKDAAATAIYGNRGASGVIVIKTKGGKYDSKLTVKYSGSTGYTTLQQNRYHITDTKEILTLERSLLVGKGGTQGTGPGGAMTDAEINSFPINTNWRDIFFRTGVTTSHDVSFSGGTSKTTNFTSFGYYEQEGIVPNTNFKRFSVRSNFTGKSANDKFNYGTNIYASFSKRNQLDQETRTDINANVLQNPLQGILSSLPYLDPNTYVSGQQLVDDFGAPSFQITPFMLMDYLKEGNVPRLYDETKLNFTANGSYNLTKNLTYSTTAGVDYIQEFRDNARAPQSYLAIVATPAGAEFGGNETQTNNRDFSFDITNKLNYKITLKEKHTIEANLFMQYVKMHRKFWSYAQTGLDPRTWAFGAGTGYIPFNTATPDFYKPAVSAGKVNAGLLSYFGTVDYDYDSRFGIAATLRRDASYRFDERNRWGTFYSVAGRWNISKEKFMDKAKFVDDLKLRVSYGTTGNQYIAGGGGGINPNYLSPNLIRDTNGTSTAYGSAPGLDVAIIANPNDKWETTTQTNIGIDFGLFDRLSGSFDVYRKRTDDLFDQINLSAVTSQWSIAGNNGSLLNKGFELALKYDLVKKGEFKVDLFVNGAYNKATYLTTNLPNNADELGGNSIRYVDGLLGEYHLAPYVGVNPANGNLLFLDINNNLTENISDADRRKTHKSPFPTYQGGFGFNASYKGFFINSQFSYAADVWRFDFDLTNLSDPTQIGTFPVTNDLLNAWTPTNTNTNVPSLTADPSNLSNGDTFSDRWLRDASYVRLKMFTIGYSVPSKLLQKTGLDTVRIYSNFENYVTWTKWRGLDPESIGGSNQGGYPSPKTVSVGLDIQF
ncbi:SusC/RagA family TonB-linked outer membrane protein [Flavobacterium sp. XGLA_31]|uniref:SusC/RagA family TonB-linked outer membrane protein n=1 Tax=Flavobacterium sp. XGLA_31 TaxID=3447666 RepID=UPI003F3616D0